MNTPPHELAVSDGPAKEVELAGATVALLQVRGVGFHYRPDSWILDHVDMTVGAGEIVSIVGPSGCGKSTLLRIIAGLRSPDKGAVVRAPDTPERHGCAMVFQEDTLLPWLKVRDNVALHYRFRGKRRAAATREHVSELLEMVGLSRQADQYPSQLSGGMRRRVAMLAAIAARPALLLLDEPFSALDEPTRVAIHRDLYTIIQALGMSVVLVTHDLAEAISLSDRVFLLSTAPAQVVREYAMPFGTDRDPSALRPDPRFLEIYGRLWKDLNDQIEVGK